MRARSADTSSHFRGIEIFIYIAVPSVSETIVAEVSNLIFEAPVRCSGVCEEGYLVVHDGTYLSRWVGFGRRSGLFRVSFIVGFRIHLVLSFRSVTLNVANISEVSARATYYSSALAYSIQHKTVNRPWRLQRLRLAHLAFRAGAFAERSRRGSRQ